MKKLLIALLLCVFAFCSLSVMGCGEKIVEYTSTTGIEYALSADRSYYVCKGRGKAVGDELVIGSKYKGLPVKEIADGAFSNDAKLKKLIVPQSIERVGANAVSVNGSLELNTYNNGAYIGNNENPYMILVKVESKADSITVHRDTKIVSGEVVADSTWVGSQLKSVNFENKSKLKVIEDGAFKGNSKLESITLPQSLTYIGKSAFASCNLKSLDLTKNKNLTTIETGAFDGNSNLEIVVIPSCVTGIGSYAFEDCSKLEIFCCHDGQPNSWANEWNVSRAVKQNNAFGPSTKEIKVNWGYGKAKKVDSNKGGYEKDSTEGLEYTLSSDGKYYICTGVGTAKASELVIGSKYNRLPVKEIKADAFSDIAFTKIVLPGSLEKIGAYSLGDRSKLKHTESNNGLYIGSASNPYLVLAKIKNQNCTSFTINESTKFIFSGAFGGCENLQGIVIPKSIVQIGEGAFSNLEKLKTVTFSEGSQLKYIESSAFRGCDGLTSIKLPENLVRIESNAFYNCRFLASVNIPGEVVEIGYATFDECGSLSTVSFVNDGKLQKIGEKAFGGCLNKRTITIPKSVVNVGANVFEGSTNTSVNCKIGAKPTGWSVEWNSTNCSVTWGSVA